MWILREATDRPARRHEMQEMAAEMLAALDPATREAVLRAACREAGLRVLTEEQAGLIYEWCDIGDHPYAREDELLGALSGEEVPHAD